MNQPQHPVDPLVQAYAPPGAQTEAAPKRRRGAFSKLVWVYAVLQLACVAARVAWVAGWIDPSAASVGAVLTGLAAGLVGIVWLYDAWQRLPERLHVVDGQHISAVSLVGRHFIPFYNLFWFFRAQQLLCGALDAKLMEKEAGSRAPTAMATLACALQLGANGVGRLLSPLPSLLAALVCGSVWTAYMVAIEQCFAQAFRKRTS